nr:xin actin-binding repeat-containing protein 2-like [Monopterus albus]
MSIKSLHETQEQTQAEKEEVIKGDVKGTIKSLMETAKRETPKVRVGAYRRVRIRQSPPAKNFNTDAQRNIQKIKTANLVQSSKENHSVSNKTETVRTKAHTVELSAQRSTVLAEHKTITQNHGIRTLKTEFRNLKSNTKGMIKLDKTKVKTDVYILKPGAPEPNLHLSPPPPVLEADLPPPPPTPPPPSVDSDIDHLPPPPPPLSSEQDFLPPPPSQQELEGMPAQAIHSSPAKAKKMTVKKVKALTLHPVPKLELKVDLSEPQQVKATSEKVIEMSQNQSKTVHVKPVSGEIPLMPESPRPLKKVYISPVRFTPPPSPPPFMRGKMSKFNTPLIKAEEKYRKMKEENTPVTTPPPSDIHDSVTAALEMLSTKDVEQSSNNASAITQHRAENTIMNSEFLPRDLSKHAVISDATQSNVCTSHEKILTDSLVTSSAKQQTASNETSKVVSVQKTSSVSAVRQQMNTTTQKTVSVSSKQSAQTGMTHKVQTSITGVAKTENMTAEKKKNFQNQKPKGSNKSEHKREAKMFPDKIPVQTVKPEIAVTTEKDIKSSKSHFENETKDNTATELPDNLFNQSSKEQNVTSDKDVKESKSLQPDNKNNTDRSPTKNQEEASDQPVLTEKAAAHTNGKTGEQNKKVKKNNKQEEQAGIKMSNESFEQSVPQDLKVEVNLISEPKEVKTELKQTIKKVSPPVAAAPTPAATVSVTGSQPEALTFAKKKKKSKKSKGVALPGQGKETSIESKTEAIETTTSTSEKSHQTQETIAAAPIQKSVKEEHIQVNKEVVPTENTDDQTSQQQKTVQQHVKASQKKKGVTVFQLSAEKAPEQSRVVPITATGESEQSELVKSTTEIVKESQMREAQVLIPHITEIQGISEKTDSKSVKTLLRTVPDWLMGQERKCELEGSAVKSDACKNKEMFSHMRKLAEDKLMHLETTETMEKHECEPVSEKGISGRASPRISKISIGSAKIENQRQKSTPQVRKKEEMSQCTSVDLRAPSPSLRTRSPSPTFITIQSTRKTDSPQRVTPSPTLLHRPPTPPTPPPRRCDTPIPLLTRITPSPTFDKAENLARLKDTTAKLSRSVTPPPLLSLQQISEIKSEIVEFPASFHRQIKTESQVMEGSGMLLVTEKILSEEAQQIDFKSEHVGEDLANISEGSNANKIQSKCKTHPPLCENDPELVEASDISEPSSGSVKEKREFFEEAQKAEINKTYVRKAPIVIPERLGPDLEECEEEKKKKALDEFPRADMSSLVNKFESAEEKIFIRKELIPVKEQLHKDTESTEYDTLEEEMPTFDIQAIRNVFELGEQSSSFRDEKRDQKQTVPSLSETTADTSKWESPHETKESSWQSTPLPRQKQEVTGTRTAVTECSESVSTQQPRLSYADALKRKPAVVRRTETYDEDATEKLLRNFHTTWTESERVFKSLGYTVSEETTSQVLSHQMKTVSSGSSSEVGAMHSMSEESLSNGCSHGGQKKVP